MNLARLQASQEVAYQRIGRPAVQEVLAGSRAVRDHGPPKHEGVTGTYQHHPKGGSNDPEIPHGVSFLNTVTILSGIHCC